MNLRELIPLLESIAPPELSEDFDTGRIGLVLDRAADIRKIAVALDPTDHVLKEAARLAEGEGGNANAIIIDGRRVQVATNKKLNLIMLRKIYVSLIIFIILFAIPIETVTAQKNDININEVYQDTLKWIDSISRNLIIPLFQEAQKYIDSFIRDFIVPLIEKYILKSSESFSDDRLIIEVDRLAEGQSMKINIIGMGESDSIYLISTSIKVKFNDKVESEDILPDSILVIKSKNGWLSAIEEKEKALEVYGKLFGAGTTLTHITEGILIKSPEYIAASEITRKLYSFIPSIPTEMAKGQLMRLDTMYTWASNPENLWSKKQLFPISNGDKIVLQYNLNRKLKRGDIVCFEVPYVYYNLNNIKTEKIKYSWVGGSAETTLQEFSNKYTSRCCGPYGKFLSDNNKLFFALYFLKDDPHTAIRIAFDKTYITNVEMPALESIYDEDAKTGKISGSVTVR